MVIWLGFGSALYSVPHFLTSPYSDTINLDLTSDNEKCPADTCSSSTFLESKNLYYGIFIAGHALNGIGSSAIQTLGTVYIDENLSEKGTPMAMAYFQTAGYAFGPAFGYIGGGALLTLWVDGNDKAPIGIPPELWVGNWWLGFWVVGIVVVVAGILITGLPHQISIAGANQRRRKSSQQRGMLETSGEFRQAHKTIHTLLKNKPFMLMVLASSIEEGYKVFGATLAVKYMEEMFGGLAGDIGMMGGVTIIISILLGQLLGGIWVHKTNPTVKKQLKFVTVVAFTSVITCFVLFYH